MKLTTEPTIEIRDPMKNKGTYPDWERGWRPQTLIALEMSPPMITGAKTIGLASAMLKPRDRWSPALASPLSLVGRLAVILRLSPQLGQKAGSPSNSMPHFEQKGIHFTVE